MPVNRALAESIFPARAGASAAASSLLPSAAATAALTGKSVTAGVAGAANTVFPSAPAGKVGVAVVLYKDTGSDATSNLIAYIDSATSGLPVTANGGDINLLFGTGPNKIFKL